MNHQIQPPLCIWGNGHLVGSPDTEQHPQNFIVQSCVASTPDGSQRVSSPGTDTLKFSPHLHGRGLTCGISRTLRK